MFTGIRPSDLVLTGLVVALAVLIGLESVTAAAGAELAHPLDSRSVLLVPVFVLTALPLLWRRRHVLPAIAVSTLVLAATLPTFGWVTRCGFALPLAAAYAYAVARFAGPGRPQLVGLLGIGALEVVTLVMDASTGGFAGLVLGVPAAVLAYGAGLGVEKLSARRANAPTLAVEHAHV